jgi:hypothetical protein
VLAAGAEPERLYQDLALGRRVDQQGLFQLRRPGRPLLVEQLSSGMALARVSVVD